MRKQRSSVSSPSHRRPVRPISAHSRGGPRRSSAGHAAGAFVPRVFLRMRRATRVVPALNLWPDQVRDRQANGPWQRLRVSSLLLLQLLAAAVLGASAVQPGLSAGTSLARHSVVLLDVSASMQATDVQPSRLDEAKREIGGIIDQLGPQDRMTVVAV